MLEQQNFIFTCYFLQSLFLRIKNPSEKILMERLFLREMVVLQAGWLAAFALLAPASLPLRSWCGQSWRPDWACFLLYAHAGAPGNCSWSVRPCRPNSTASHTLGSLRGISCRGWGMWSNDTKLALAVPGRLDSCRARRIGHSAEKEALILDVLTAQ
jgi:hypothetical protein